MLPWSYSATAFRSRVTRLIKYLGLIFCPNKFYHLRDRFLFKFILLRHICVGYKKIPFCEQLSFNPFVRTFVQFTIFVLTWYNFTPYYMILTILIPAWVFQPWSILFRCII